jgi:hypothetical protein
MLLKQTPQAVAEDLVVIGEEYRVMMLLDR